MIRSIVFDMGGVLMEFKPDQFIERLGVAEEDRELLRREIFPTVEWNQLDRGTLTDEEAAEIFRARLPERLRPYVEPLVFDWWKSPLTPVEGMEELIAELKGLGYGIYLLSNAGRHHPQFFPTLPCSRYFDGLVVSYQWKMLKPEREIYQVLFREYALKPEECLFIDDLVINIEAGIFAGMPGIVFRHDIPRLRRELNAAGIPVESE